MEEEGRIKEKVKRKRWNGRKEELHRRSSWHGGASSLSGRKGNSLSIKRKKKPVYIGKQDRIIYIKTRSEKEGREQEQETQEVKKEEEKGRRKKTC